MITKITLLVTAALIDLMMIGFGLLFFRRSPASVNAFFGYRTVRSMASPEAWAFAHRHFGKLILIVGVIWAPLSLGAISLLSFGGVEQYEPICAMIVLAQLIPFLIAIVSTERALKRCFDESGRPYPMLARDAAPILDDLKNAKETFWENPHRITGAAAFGKAPFSVGDVADASARLSRFASYFAVAFPETADNGGLLESPLRKIPTMQQTLEARYGVKIAGDLYIKLDSHLPVSGSIKARGGIYEVLCFAEHIAISEGGLLPTDDYAILDTPRFRALFSTYSIAVGSTGNLGLSIGLIGSRLGFSVTVHMSADAKQWKKDLLRSRGVRVVEHKGDYTAAVEYGRRIAERDPRCHFVDDENSALLFLGYAVAAERLAKQLREQKITVDREHPLYVYLPCGIGGAPGGVGFGLKLMFGDAVHLYFAEPTHAPCMLLGMATGRHSAISVTDIGLDPHTKADGLAVGRPSGFVGALMEPLLEGCYTVSDERMSAHLALLAEQEDIHLEPSALAGMYGPVVLQKQKNAPQAGTHIVWATGGSMVPPTEQDAYLKEGLDCLRNGF